MAIDRWALITYGHYWLGAVLHISVATDTPVHLSITHTETKPVFYSTGKIVRGEAFMANPRYAFINATEQEQTEPGDTINHTFTIPGWTDGLQRWWYFDGTIGGQPTICNTGFIHAQAFNQEEAFTMRHIDLTHKEAAGIIDHADGSITPAKLASPFTFTAIPMVPPAWPTQDYEITSKDYVDQHHTQLKWLSTWHAVVFVPGVSATTGWADVDLSPWIPIQTAQVMLSIHMKIFSISPTGQARLWVRDPDLTTHQDYIPSLWLAHKLGHRAPDELAIQLIVAPTATRKIQWRALITPVMGVQIYIRLMGYGYYQIP